MRSQLRFVMHPADDRDVAAYLTEGSPGAESLGLERRYRSLSNFIKKRYSNPTLRWSNPSLPPADAGRSGNPSREDRQLWVGPHALQWLRQGHTRRVKLDKESVVEAYLNDCET